MDVAFVAMEKHWLINTENAREMQRKSAKKKTENAIFRTEARKHRKEIAAGIKELAKMAAVGDRGALSDLYRYTGEERMQVDMTSDGRRIDFVVTKGTMAVIEALRNGSPDE